MQPTARGGERGGNGGRMGTPTDRPPGDTRSFKKRSPGRYVLLVLALFAVFAAVFGIPSYLGAVEDGTLAHWWGIVGLIAGLYAVMIAIAIPLRISRTRRRLASMRATANAGLKKLTMSHPDATLAGSLVPRGLSEALQFLGHKPLVGVRMLAVMTDPTQLSLWSIDGRPRRFASFPAASVEGFEYRRPKPRAPYTVVTAVIQGDSESIDLPLVLVPLHPRHTTEAGRALLLELLSENLRHGIRIDVPDEVNPYLLTEAEAAALHSATVRKPALAIDESGVFDDRAELR